MIQTGFKRILKDWKRVSPTLYMFLIVKSKGAINLHFWVEFRKCNILHFPTYRHPRGRLAYGLIKNLQTIEFAISTANFIEIEEKHQKIIERLRGMLSAVNPMEIYTVMLIKF